MSDLRLRLPATSANLGPGFDTLAVALELYLTIDASPSTALIVEATGRDAAICASTKNNLVVDTYRAILAAHGRELIPLRLQVHNEIPLGMGCGSSAAARLAGVAMASHFGELHWERDRILAEAARLEGHPDNAAACWLGGFVACASSEAEIGAIAIAPPEDWRAVIVMPSRPLATTAARAILPESYSRRDAVANLQRVALLTAAFAAQRADLIPFAMRDRLHQPYRADVCPLLPKLLPLAGREGILGVALSGAGPSVLLLTGSASAASRAQELAAMALGNPEEIECLTCRLAREPARCEPLQPAGAGVADPPLVT